MNELKLFIADYQKVHNLTRGTLIQKVGYKNISKGLRVLDAFIELPVNNTFKIQLCRELNISIKSMDEVVNKQMEKVNKVIHIQAEKLKKEEINNFTPYIRVKWTRNPSLLITAQPSEHLYKIPVTESLLKQPIHKQMKKVCHLYKQHQLHYYAEKYNLENSMDNYDELVRMIESKLKDGIDIGWSIGNGFTYHKSFYERYKFNRLCKKIK